MSTIIIKKTQFEQMLEAIERATQRGIEKGLRSASAYNGTFLSANQIYRKYGRTNRVRQILSQTGTRTGDAVNSKCMVKLDEFEKLFYNNQS